MRLRDSNPFPSASGKTVRFDPTRGTLAGEAQGLYPSPTVGGPVPGDLPLYNFQIKLGEIGFDNSAGGPSEVRVEGVTLTETFNRMGQAAGDFLRGFDPAPVLPTTPTATGPMPPMLSCVLERLGVEAVMELSPRFEELPRREMPPTLSLRDVFAVPLYPSNSGLRDVPAWLTDLAHPEDPSSVAARRRAFPWRIRERDGVFEIVDPVAFLDRAQWISPVPYLQSERILATLPPDAPKDPQGVPLPDWDHLEAIAATGLGPGGTAYRRLPLGGFASLLPIARLVRSVPPGDRAALWAQAQTPGGAKVSVNGGALTLRLERWGAEYGYAKPVAHIVGLWTGPGGATLDGVGVIDPRGLL